MHISLSDSGIDSTLPFKDISRSFRESLWMTHTKNMNRITRNVCDCTSHVPKYKMAVALGKDFPKAFKICLSCEVFLNKS